MDLAPPPDGLIIVPIPKAVLLLTIEEYTRGIRRGKWWRRRVAMLAREAREGAPQAAQVPSRLTTSTSAGSVPGADTG